MAAKQARSKADDVMTSVRVPRHMLHVWQATASITRRTQSDILRSALTAYLKREIRRRDIRELVDALVRERAK